MFLGPITRPGHETEIPRNLQNLRARETFRGDGPVIGFDAFQGLYPAVLWIIRI